MRAVGAAVLLALCALPARSQVTQLTPQILHALTSIDTLPTKEELQLVLNNPSNELAVLSQLSQEGDFGMRLRAIRAIPHFCPGQVAACRDAILSVLASETGDGQQILLQRAAIEALAAARTGSPEDVPILAAFLRDDSRDLRVAAARALRDLCDPAAMPDLAQRRAVESIGQVKKAIDEALLVLGQCGQ